MFSNVLRTPLLQKYVRVANEAVCEDIQKWGDQGELEVFTMIKSLVHSIGFRCWVGEEVADPSILNVTGLETSN